MMLSDNTLDAYSSEKATQFYWGSSDYESYTKGDAQGATIPWTTDSVGDSWNPSKTLVIKNTYPGLLSTMPAVMGIDPKVNNGTSQFGHEISQIGSDDGVIAEDAGTTTFTGIGSYDYTYTFMKSGNDLSVIICLDDVGNLGSITSISLDFYASLDTAYSSFHDSVIEVTVGESGNGSGFEQYVLGDPHTLAVNVSGIKSNNVTLIDMGDRMDLIAGHEIGEHIVSSDSIVTSRVARENNTVIQSGSNVQSGTFVGIYAEAPFMEDGKAGAITITCGQTTVGYYYISNASDSLKQCLFRMPDGDTVVSIVYNTAHVTFQGDNGSVVAKRNINNVWYQDEYFFEGETVALTATADNGYLFDSFEVKSGEVSITNGTFVVGDSDIVIEANFVEKEYNISITQATGGTVTPSKLKAKAGEAITLSVTTFKGYSLTSLSSLQIPSMTKDTRSFDMPASDVSITVEYEQMAQLSCTATQSSGMTILDVTVAANIGAGMEDPVFLIAGTYDGDIVVNAYSHIKTGTDHIERVSFSSYGLQEIFVQLVEGISSDPTGYFCVYTVEVGA